ncbi:MAG TPA: folylpolyglutamate synthase/dihydrofolate synthase family protein [Flavisolibacter sp.]|nr:folylpolyglutamate synthase/dihydrofolate synthase family protein [Flavisolibacter sp.]
MTYQQTLDYIFQKLPMFSRIGSAAYKKDLNNIRALCDYLGNPQQHFQTIHVGGTNGKGSTSHMLAAVLQTSGYKTGLYTSPHLYDFRERIRINGEMIPTDFVIQFVEKIKPWIEEISPSFFEITVAMAFEFFAQQKIDIAIIEVGLGGRLDSTNIIHPLLSVITNIGLDHMDMLGDTLEAIAFEKAGIIKDSTPVVIGEALPQTKIVFLEQSRTVRAPIYFAEEEITIESYQHDDFCLSIQYTNNRTTQTEVVSTDLIGLYQLKNVRTVLCALSQLERIGLNINKANLKQGLANTKQLTGLMGRWEIISEKPALILEVAHNVDGIKAMLLHIEKLNFQKLHIIIGVVKDKDIQKIMSLLPVEAQYYFTQAAIPRALNASILQQSAHASGLYGSVYKNVNKAIELALTNASKDDGIVVCGSIFLVGEVNRDQFTMD